MESRDHRRRILETPRLASPGGFHAPQIELAACYSTINPGNSLGGTWLPLCWNKHKDDPGDPDYIALGTAPNIRQISDPAYILCAGVGDIFWVIRDPYRKVWMPLHPYGLIRHAALGANLAPGGSAANSTVQLYDSTGAGTGSIGSVTIYSGQSAGDTTPSGGSIPVAFISAEQKWYTLVESP